MYILAQMWSLLAVRGVVTVELEVVLHVDLRHDEVTPTDGVHLWLSR